MDSILKEDERLGELRNHACETISLSQTIRNYTNALGSLDYKHCPGEFTSAFYQHSDAWNKMIPITNRYPDIRGEMHDLFDQIRSGEDSMQFITALDLIWSTWAEVEQLTKEKE